MTEEQIDPLVERAAQDLASKYRQMQYGVGQPVKTSAVEIAKIIQDAANNLPRKLQSQLRPRLFFGILNLPRDPVQLSRQFERDFPGKTSSCSRRRWR